MQKNQTPAKKVSWVVTAAVVAVLFALSSGLWAQLHHRSAGSLAPRQNKTVIGEAPNQTLTDASASADVTSVTTTPPVSKFSASGIIEPNLKQIQQLTPLVSGRVAQVLAATGDKVSKGQVLVVLDSPQVAEMHGKLHESETRLLLARNQLERAKQNANKVNVLKSKATLAEAEAAVRRDQALLADGLVAKKDVLAAEYELERARADYDFQKNISLNREINEAASELSTAQTEVTHLRDGLKALDGYFESDKQSGAEHDIAKVELRAPISGTVIDRFINEGAGADLFKPMLTIADTSSVWVVASVPAIQLHTVKPGQLVKINASGLSLNGKVVFVDPRLDRDTQTGRVRIEVENSSTRLATGTFARVDFSRVEIDPKARVYIPIDALQRIGQKSIVFVQTPSGNFEKREVQTGPLCCDRVAVYKGLSPGEKIADKNTVNLKSQMLKSEFGSEGNS